MAPESLTQERVYRAIKQDLFEGNGPRVARLDIQSIADRHIASTTPVREALHRLVGEGLLEHHPEGGIRIALLRSAALRQLYQWNTHHLLGIVRLAGPVALRQAIDRVRNRLADPRRETDVRLPDVLFSTMAEATRNQEFIDLTVRANERLHFVRRAEVAVFSDPHREINRILRNGRLDIGRLIRARISAYHKRREENVEEISRRLFRGFGHDE